MGNCGTREESAVVSNAQVQQQLNHMLSSSSVGVRNGVSEKKHSRSVSDLSDPSSTPRKFEDSRKNAVLYTHVIAFTLYELETITKSFRSDYILGEGGFGTVYKGYIDENVRVGLKSLPVAVKVLNKEGYQGHREWLTEVNFLGQLRHPNLVKLIGYCCEDDHRLLVYEFMFRGSLENHLFRKATVPLSWATRLMIALGAAKGLAFLHNAERPVIYRDFKTSNILLDSDYTAKLSDFGLAKAGPQGDETHVSTRVMGTYGYAAPEYVMTGHLTARSDVYSFGVVLLELLTGRKSVDKTRPSKEQSLVDWARPKLNDKRKMLQIIDPRLENQYSVRAAQKACSLAYYCLSQNPKARPLMSDVVETLEPLQCSNDGANEISSTPNLAGGTGAFAMGGVPDYRMRRRFTNTDGRSSSASRQHLIMEKGGDILQDAGGVIRRLPAGGEGWDTKNKKKRSVGLVGSRVINGDRDLKRAIHPKIGADSKLRSCDAQGFRSKSSPGVGGINKLDSTLEPSGSDTSTVLRNEMDTGTLSRDRLSPLEQKVVTKGSNKPNIHEDNLGSSPNTMIKPKVSRGPRTMVLDSSLRVQSSSTSLQGAEQPTSSNKVAVPGVVNNHKRQISAGSASMAQWVGQRPHKNSRTRRANIVAPVSNNVETQIPSQGFQANDMTARTSLGANGSIVSNSADNTIPKFKREIDSVPSPFGLSESEESGAGENKTKDKGIDSGEVALTATQKAGPFLMPARSNKLPTSEIGDGIRRQGRSGRGSLTRPAVHTVRDNLENLPTMKPLQSVKPTSDRNKSKTGRPPSKKLKERKSLARVGPLVNSGSVDFTGESDDDHEELFLAANSARNSSNRACCGPFWKKMESVFSSVSSVDMSYLKQQLSFAEELDESLSQMLGGDYNLLGVLVHKEISDYSGERQGNDSNQESFRNASLCGKIDIGKLEKGAPLYQRVLSALIEEEESEEFYFHGEGKNMPLHYASDDSHCGSCNLIDIEPKDRDRVESEVESKVNFQTQKNSFLERFSYDKSVASNTIRNPSMPNSLHSNEQWPGDDDFSQLESGHTSEISSNDVGQRQTKELNMSGFSSSDLKYQLMCLDDRVMLELQSIGICPETLPDLAEGEEVINQDIIGLKEGLYEQIGRKKRKLGKIDKAIQKGKEVEKRDIEQVAMDQLIEMAYRKRLACRGNNSSKSAVRKVSRQVALAFIKRTLARCRKFEDTGSSCFSEPTLQEVIFATPPSNNDAKSVDCVGSGTASNTCNEVSNHHAEARGSGAVSSALERDDSHGDYFDRGKKREVLIDDVIGSASSRVTSTLDSGGLGGVKGRRSDRDRDQNKDAFKSERKTKSKPKQKINHFSTSGNGPRGSAGHSAANASNKTDREISLGNVPRDASKEADEGVDLGNLQLNELDTIGLDVPNELGGPPDLYSWLNFDDDGLQDHDSIGLAIPMDDLTELNMIM